MGIRRRIVDIPSDPPATVRCTMAPETRESQVGRFKPFAYLATQNAGLYRRVMLAFVTAKRRFVVHMRTEDVVAELAADGPDDPKAVTDALSQLVEWGNLRADPDTSRVTSVEDFHRARFLYQLTPPAKPRSGRSRCSTSSSGRRGALQAVALEDIATGLRALRELRTTPSRTSADGAAAARPRAALHRSRRQRPGVHGIAAANDRPVRARRRRIPRLQGPPHRLPRAVHQGPHRIGGEIAGLLGGLERRRVTAAGARRAPRCRGRRARRRRSRGSP